MSGKKTLKIKSIQVNGKTVFIRLKDEDFKKKKKPAG